MKGNLFTFVPSLLSVAVVNAMANNLEEKLFLLHYDSSVTIPS